MSTHSAVDLALCLPLPASAALPLAAGLMFLLSNASASAAAGEPPPFEVRVEVEETAFEVPAYKVTNNGSGMFWGSGSSQLVRIGDKLFASAFEAVPGCAPLNNARWALYARGADGWHFCQRDLKERTREPCPLGVSHAGRLLMSVNPTLAPWIDAPPDGKGAKVLSRGGPARPEFLEFDSAHPGQEPKHWIPKWEGQPEFTEHSYRAFAADGANGEFILFHKVGSTHTAWAFLDREGKWKTGQLLWPKGEDPRYSVWRGERTPVNYANVALSNRQAYYIGQSPYNIWNRIDPLQTETWGRSKWGWRMRKLHYAWTPDITTTPFVEWRVVDDTMDDGGTIGMGDSWLAPDGRLHLVWQKTPIHPKLRDTHFPDIKRDWRICYGTLKDGKLLEKRVLFAGGETTGPVHPSGYIGHPRLHVTPDHTLYVICKLTGTTPATREQSGTYAVRIGAGGTVSAPVRIPLERPIKSAFFTATPRAGNRLTDAADLLIADTIDGRPVVRYARVRFGPAQSPKITISGKTLALPGEGREVHLVAEASDPQNDVASIQWRLPGGNVRRGASLRWNAPASLGARLVVEVVATDRAGNSGRARKVVSLPPAELAQTTGLMRVEGEAFVAQGGGKARICHTVNASGTSISYWHVDLGHWLEWELEAPADGRYELWMRYTTACGKTRRSLQIDGAVPNPACADIAVPTTGGWSGTEDNWHYLKLAPPLGRQTPPPHDEPGRRLGRGLLRPSRPPVMRAVLDGCIEPGDPCAGECVPAQASMLDGRAHDVRLRSG